MAKISKYIKLDKNILLEYIYDEGNLISEPYNILLDSRDRRQAYMAGTSSTTANTVSNQLFKLDTVTGKYAKVNTTRYSFLQLKDYTAGTPVRHDTLRFHLPINWTFGEYLGFYVRVYGFDTSSSRIFEISNFYFDMTDVSQSYLLNFTSPPLLFQEKLWGKNIQIDIPSISGLSSQKTNNSPTPNSINANLTNALGMNSTTPVFIDFHYIKNIQTVNALTTYLLTPKITSTVPQTPEFERLGLVIENSPNGDFFEIYGTYNNTIAGFNQFIEESFNIGHRYYVQYNITMYEQNTRGKTITVTQYDNFLETVEYRPIIKYSTTTAIIDVEMRLIDQVDDSYILRRASYGMLQDEVGKYSMSMIKINLASSNVAKPKIYNIKSSIDPSLVGFSNSFGKITKPKSQTGAVSGLLNGAGGNVLNGAGGNVLANGNATPRNDGNSLPVYPWIGGMDGSGAFGGGALGAGAGGALNGGLGAGTGAGGNGAGVVYQTVQVPFPVLIDRFNIIGKSDNAIVNKETFYGSGKITIPIYPFDNIVKFVLADGDATTPRYLDLSSYGEIKLQFKNDGNLVDVPLYMKEAQRNVTGQSSVVIDLSIGLIAFRIQEAKVGTLKKIFQSGVNIFYITATNQGITSVIYTGLFKIYDNVANVAQLNAQAPSPNSQPSIIKDPNLPQETATVTRRPVSQRSTPTPKPGGNTTGNTNNF